MSVWINSTIDETIGDRLLASIGWQSRKANSPYHSSGTSINVFWMFVFCRIHSTSYTTMWMCCNVCVLEWTTHEQHESKCYLLLLVIINLEFFLIEMCVVWAMHGVNILKDSISSIVSPGILKQISNVICDITSIATKQRLRFSCNARYKSNIWFF